MLDSQHSNPILLYEDEFDITECETVESSQRWVPPIGPRIQRPVPVKSSASEWSKMKKEKVAPHIGDKKRVRSGEGKGSSKKVRYSEELIVPASPPQVITKPPVSIMKNKSADKKSESKDSVKSVTSAKTSAKDTTKDTAKDAAKAKSSAKDTAKDTTKDDAKATSSAKDTAKAKSSAKDTAEDNAKYAATQSSAKDTAKDTVKEDAKAKSSAKDTAKAQSSAKDTVKDDAKAKSSAKDTAKDTVKDDAKAKSSAKDTAKDTTKSSAKDDTKAKSSTKKDTESEISNLASSSKLSVVASSSSQVTVASSKGKKTGTKAPVKASNGKNGGKISVKNVGIDRNNTEPTNNIYIGHIPDGFEEKEMRSFFKQFGDVRKVKLFRSEKTNRSRGYAFAQFKDKDVAKVVADTMNGYLIMGRQLVCHVIPQGKCHDGMYKRKYNKELTSKPRDVNNNDDED